MAAALPARDEQVEGWITVDPAQPATLSLDVPPAPGRLLVVGGEDEVTGAGEKTGWPARERRGPGPGQGRQCGAGSRRRDAGQY
jgi:hypothetical protein